MGVGKIRNEPCYCGSGKKYKHCCLNKKNKGEELRKKLLNFSRKDFITGPYKHCPNDKCIRTKTNSYGVNIPTGNSEYYSRECLLCGYTQRFDLPKIKKKIIYLDQYVISNLIKLLDPDHPSHEKIKADHFWKKLFIKLDLQPSHKLLYVQIVFFIKMNRWFQGI